MAFDSGYGFKFGEFPCEFLACKLPTSAPGAVGGLNVWSAPCAGPTGALHMNFMVAFLHNICGFLIEDLFIRTHPRQQDSQTVAY